MLKPSVTVRISIARVFVSSNKNTRVITDRADLVHTRHSLLGTKFVAVPNFVNVVSNVVRSVVVSTIPKGGMMSRFSSIYVFFSTFLQRSQHFYVLLDLLYAS